MNKTLLLFSSAGSMIFIAAALWGTALVPFIPYNVRELLGGGQSLIPPVFLTLFLYWTFAAPVLTVRWAAPAGPILLPYYVAFVLLHGTIAWTLLFMSGAMESLHDLVGTPVLEWPWHFELLGRFTALFGVLSLALFWAVFVARWIQGRGSLNDVFYGCLALILLLPLIHWIVVIRAATDNLTELMAGGGDFSASLALFLAVFLLVLAAVYAGAQTADAKKGAGWVSLLLCMISYPLVYTALSSGLENRIIKYGQEFSALQFLLSTDRSHLAHGPGLLIRYGIFHTAVLVMIMFIQFPFWNLNPARKREESKAG